MSTPPPDGRPSTILRARFAPWPLQQSYFDRLGSVPMCLELPADVPPIAAGVDDAGRVVLDATAWQHVRTATARQLGPGLLASMLTTHRRRLEALRWWLTRARPVDAATHDELVRDAVMIGDALANLAPYGLVTKAVAEPLRRAASPAADVGQAPSAPCTLPCAGPSVTRDLHRLLIQACAQLLDAGLRTAAAIPRWSEAPHAAVDIVAALSQRLTGAGSRSWNAIGYESPEFVYRMLTGRISALGESGVQRLAAAAPSPPGPQENRSAAAGSPMARCAAYWASYVNEQAGLLRWGFYVGVLPRLARLAAHWCNTGMLSRPGDVCFLTRTELWTGPDRGWAGRAAHRRARMESCSMGDRRDEYADDALDTLLTTTHAIPPAATQWFAWLSRRIESADLLLAELATLPPDHRWISAPEPAATTPTGSRDGHHIDGATRPTLPFELSGIPATPGRRTCAPAFVSRTAGDWHAAPAGVVLVADLLGPDQTPAMWSACGIVVEEGGLTQHAALIASELHLPCLVGVRGAASLIRTGDEVTLDSETGRVLVRPAWQPAP